MSRQSAAGLAHGAIGTDTGGSIRGPAAYCALTGLKPTFGLVSRFGVVPLSYSLDHVGPMTRSAADCRLMLEVIAGYDSRDPVSRGEEHWRDDGLLTDLRGVRVGLLVDLVEELPPEVRSIYQAAIDQLRAAGAAVEPVAVPWLDLVSPLTMVIATAEAASYQADWLRERPDDYTPGTLVQFQTGALLPASTYLDAQRFRRQFTDTVNQLFQRFDVLCLPTTSDLPPPISELSLVPEGSAFAWDGRHTVIANLTGCPALAFPCGFTSETLPVSLQIVGRAFADGFLLRMAELYQASTSWHRRRPPAVD
jgi:aspartyl-tRNA(Asn)/glutamyl-tRNA(Gln) amidotransferase subunit A